MKKTIKIIIDTKGNARLEGIGFQGTECDRIMGQIERALGAVTERRNKPEYNNATATVGNGNRWGGQS